MEFNYFHTFTLEKNVKMFLMFTTWTT